MQHQQGEYDAASWHDEAWHRRHERHESLLAGLSVVAIGATLYGGVLFPEKAQATADYLAQHMAEIADVLPLKPGF